ncbi:MAG: nicotinate phosphoribosyltransferase, partial [Clostridiales bacterium]|nr:nicotinate phosphoribosyltransferase [Clostridiales bacterium]
MLDKAGFEKAIICASGDLDEYSITSLKAQGANIDSWGVGTKLITSADMPALGGVYKLAAVYENGKEIPKIKLSDNSEKITNPALKEVYRIYDRATDKAIADYITLYGEEIDESKPLELFHPVDKWKSMKLSNFRVRKLREPLMQNGKRANAPVPVQESAKYFKQEFSRFWEEYTRQDMPHIYKVDLSPDLQALKSKLIGARKGV